MFTFLISKDIRVAVDLIAIEKSFSSSSVNNSGVMSSASISNWTGWGDSRRRRDWRLFNALLDSSDIVVGKKGCFGRLVAHFSLI